MLAIGPFNERRPPAAGVVAGSFALDLDDIGPQVSKHLPRPGPGQDAGKFEDAETRQRLRHAVKLLKDAEGTTAGVIKPSFRAGQTGNCSLPAWGCVRIS